MKLLVRFIGVFLNELFFCVFCYMDFGRILNINVILFFIFLNNGCDYWSKFGSSCVDWVDIN